MVMLNTLCKLKSGTCPACVCSIYTDLSLVYVYVCFSCVDTYPNVSLRLAGESSDSNPNKGRVEILYNGVWGTVCQYGLGFEDARVVCRQLGFPTALTVLNTYDPGTEPTLLENTTCSGEEEGIQYCKNSGWHSGDGCDSDFRVGVECAGVFVI